MAGLWLDRCVSPAAVVVLLSMLAVGAAGTAVGSSGDDIVYDPAGIAIRAPCNGTIDQQYCLAGSAELELELGYSEVSRRSLAQTTGGLPYVTYRAFEHPTDAAGGRPTSGNRYSRGCNTYDRCRQGY